MDTFQVKVPNGIYTINILIKYRHFMHLKFQEQCQSTGSYSVLFYSCFSIKSNGGGLSGKVKHEHHALYPIYSYGVPSLQIYFELNMSGALPTIFLHRLPAK